MADRAFAFNRYSNTLLLSLNNRISYRDTYGTPGGVVDLRVVPFPINAASSEATMETIAIEPEKPQEDLMGQPAEVEESESHDPHVMMPTFS